MCAIAGILKFDGQSTFSIGHDLLRMATRLQYRGAHSAGVAVFSPHDDQTHLLSNGTAQAPLCCC